MKTSAFYTYLILHREPSLIHALSEIPAVPADPSRLIDRIQQKFVIPVEITDTVFPRLKLGFCRRLINRGPLFTGHLIFHRHDAVYRRLSARRVCSTGIIFAPPDTTPQTPVPAHPRKNQRQIHGAVHLFLCQTA